MRGRRLLGDKSVVDLGREEDVMLGCMVGIPLYATQT